MLLLSSQEEPRMKSDYFHGLFKHGATGATETKNPNNNADLALPNGVAQNKNERATGATKPISAHHPVALIAPTKKEGATEGASLEARTGTASGEVLPQKSRTTRRAGGLRKAPKRGYLVKQVLLAIEVFLILHVGTDHLLV
jgi:hypothetical protein